MKKIENFDELPDELLEDFGIERSEKDDLTWEEWEDELIHHIKDGVGYQGEPKKKVIDNCDYYVHTFPATFGKVKMVAQTKQYIKEYDVICYEEPHGLFIKNFLGF